MRNELRQVLIQLEESDETDWVFYFNIFQWSENMRDIFFEFPGWAVRCRWRASHCRLPTIPTALARTQRHIMFLVIFFPKELDVENWRLGSPANSEIMRNSWTAWTPTWNLYPPLSTCTLQVQMLQFVFCLLRLSQCASLGCDLVCFLWRKNRDENMQ